MSAPNTTRDPPPAYYTQGSYQQGAGGLQAVGVPSTQAAADEAYARRLQQEEVRSAQQQQQVSFLFTGCACALPLYVLVCGSFVRVGELAWWYLYEQAPIIIFVRKCNQPAATFVFDSPLGRSLGAIQLSADRRQTATGGCDHRWTAGLCMCRLYRLTKPWEEIKKKCKNAVRTSTIFVFQQ